MTDLMSAIDKYSVREKQNYKDVTRNILEKVIIDNKKRGCHR